MLVRTAYPVNVRQCRRHAPKRVPHAHQGRKVTFLGEMRVPNLTWHPEFRPEYLVTNNKPRMLTCQCPNLGSYAKVAMCLEIILPTIDLNYFANHRPELCGRSTYVLGSGQVYY
ncbi:hypothetical protein L6164_022898 [Bauhinia variegata]|uniref:Uncharacterized protein n=1 Tax=Bauhinia variegata TaxID=167791 RepID=A0ACB9MGH7_BAUVA|nr:hypothetical protein L6164_022898 [Bauhinia variegata]